MSHIDNEHQKDSDWKHTHDSWHDIDEGDKPLRPVREMHALEHKPKHKHYIDEIHHIHEWVVELGGLELAWRNII